MSARVTCRTRAVISPAHISGDESQGLHRLHRQWHGRLHQRSLPTDVPHGQHLDRPQCRRQLANELETKTSTSITQPPIPTQRPSLRHRDYSSCPPPVRRLASSWALAMNIVDRLIGFAERRGADRNSRQIVFPRQRRQGLKQSRGGKAGSVGRGVGEQRADLDRSSAVQAHRSPATAAQRDWARSIARGCRAVATRARGRSRSILFPRAPSSRASARRRCAIRTPEPAPVSTACAAAPSSTPANQVFRTPTADSSSDAWLMLKSAPSGAVEIDDGDRLVPDRKRHRQPAWCHQ